MGRDLRAVDPVHDARRVPVDAESVRRTEPVAWNEGLQDVEAIDGARVEADRRSVRLCVELREQESGKLLRCTTERRRELHRSAAADEGQR